MPIRGILAVTTACLSAGMCPAWAQFQTNVTITNANSAPVTQTLQLSSLTLAAGGGNNALSSTYQGLSSGLQGVVTFAGRSATFNTRANSTAVTVTAFGSSQTFDAGSRRASLEAAVNNYLRNANNSINGSNVASNPSVGSPQSLAGRMVGRDFQQATGIGSFDQTGLPGGPPSTGGAALIRTPNALTTGGEVSYASAGGVDVTSVTVPLNYTGYFADPRYSIAIDVPLSYIKVGSANVGAGSAGAILKFPVADNWSLSAATRLGAVGSEDLLVGSLAYSGTIGSQYVIFADDYKISIGNALGFVKTTSFRIGAYNTGPTRLNVPFVNGLSVEGALPFTIFDKPTSYEAYVVDTYFAGQQLAVRHYDEIGVNFGTRRRIGDQSWDTARVGLAYTVGKSFNMVSLRASYRF